ncbi:MAG: hypothetical protein KF813_04315 [Trueperaceae bacterium]|nr:hypothetical protein [Trueperaceae bacterium]
MTDLTWIDLVLVLVIASLVALGANRRLIGLFVGVGALLLMRPLLSLGQGNPWFSIAVAFVCGLALALLARKLVAPGKGPELVFKIAGGFGGLLLGSAMVLALVTSLPIERPASNPGVIYYPPRTVGARLHGALEKSPLVTLGKSILLHPLLADAEGSPQAQRVLSSLHTWLVVGEPWFER